MGWRHIYLLPHILNVTYKVKELQYSILHNYIRTNKLLYKMKLIESPNCNFCHMYSQSTVHLLYDCFCVKNLWLFLKDLILRHYALDIEINIKVALFGWAVGESNVEGDYLYKSINILI